MLFINLGKFWGLRLGAYLWRTVKYPESEVPWYFEVLLHEKLTMDIHLAWYCEVTLIL